ncbi:MAG: PAS domain S-box protein [Deltaproteobacteria bacterium]|nr:PAS domain S-box protein [Deltaproteobacteria bacterium]
MGGDGQPVNGFLGLDISETLVENLRAIVLILDGAGRIVRFNRYTEEITGYRLGEVQGSDWFSTFLPERDRDRIRVLFRTAVSGVKTMGNVNPIVTRDGRELEIEWWDTTLKGADGARIGLLSLGHDVTERVRQERKIRESEQKFREMAEHLPQMVIELTELGGIVFVNRQGMQVMGFSQEDLDRGVSMFDLIAPEDHARVKANFDKSLSGGPSGNEYTATRKDGTTFPIIVHSTPVIRDGRPVGLRAIVVDISERKRQEEERLRRGKLESTGVLAGGIAHDFNNLLAAILGNIEVARLSLLPDHDAWPCLAEAVEATLAARSLTARLVTFAEGGAPLVRAVAIGRLLRECVRATLEGPDVRVGFSIPRDLRHVECDEMQIWNVVRNMIINAVEAMPGGGDILVAARNIAVGEGVRLPLDPGDYVAFSIRDHGPGIPEEAMEKLFDPYFSTKKRGSDKGMGLGLTICDSIVRKHRGHIEVEPGVGQGATFRVFLPVFEERNGET